MVLLLGLQLLVQMSQRIRSGFDADRLWRRFDGSVFAEQHPDVFASPVDTRHGAVRINQSIQLDVGPDVERSEPLEEVPQVVHRRIPEDLLTPSRFAVELLTQMRDQTS